MDIHVDTEKTKILLISNLNKEEIGTMITQIETLLDDQKRDLPFNFCADEELVVWAQDPDMLEAGLRSILESFINYYDSVAARASMFRHRHLLEDELEQRESMIYH